MIAFIGRFVRRRLAVAISAILGSVLVLAGAGAVAAASGSAVAFYNGFEQNTSGWYGQITRLSSGAANPAGSYGSGISAAGGGNYASASQATGDNQIYTQFGTSGNSVQFPAGGFTTSVAIYLDAAWAANHPTPKLFDWDTALNQSNGNFLSDFIFNVGTTAEGAAKPGFYVQASQNSQPGSAYATNPCSPLVQGSCVAPALITNSGWYTFTHHFYESQGNLAVQMTITDSQGNQVASWTADPVYVATVCKASCAAPISAVGGVAYGWFDYQEVNGLPFDNSEMLVPLAPPAPIEFLDITGPATDQNPAGTVITNPTGTVGQFFFAVLHSQGGVGYGNWNVASGTVPPGLSVDTSGAIIGTPTKAGTYTFTVQVTDLAMNAAQQQITITIAGAK